MSKVCTFYLLQINSLCPKILPITFQGRSGSLFIFLKKVSREENTYLNFLFAKLYLPYTAMNLKGPSGTRTHTHTHTQTHTYTHTCLLAHVFNTLSSLSYDNCLNSNPSEQTKWLFYEYEIFQKKPDNILPNFPLFRIGIVGI